MLPAKFLQFHVTDMNSSIVFGKKLYQHNSISNSQLQMKWFVSFGQQ